MLDRRADEIEEMAVNAAAKLVQEATKDKMTRKERLEFYALVLGFAIGFEANRDKRWWFSDQAGDDLFWELVGVTNSAIDRMLLDYTIPDARAEGLAVH